jgi:hypothetical protein
VLAPTQLLVLVLAQVLVLNPALALWPVVLEAVVWLRRCSRRGGRWRSHLQPQLLLLLLHLLLYRGDVLRLLQYRQQQVPQLRGQLQYFLYLQPPHLVQRQQLQRQLLQLHRRQLLQRRKGQRRGAPHRSRARLLSWAGPAALVLLPPPKPLRQGLCRCC